MMQTAAAATTILLDHAPIPTVNLAIDESIRAISQPGIKTRCLIANAVRQQVVGAKNVEVDRHYIKFSAPGTDRDGKVKMMRYAYPTPAYAVKKLIEYDESETNKAIVIKDFGIRLQSERAFAGPTVVRRTVGRGPTVKRTPKPANPETAFRNCVRRSHGAANISPTATTMVVSQPGL